MSNAPDTEFKVKIASSGEIYTIPADKTIVEVLEENGVDIETSCETGLCGTCITRVLEGEPEHRDMVLDDDEHKEYMCVCCSRASTDTLTLDL